MAITFAVGVAGASPAWASGVAAWGYGEQGELGDGMVINRDVPVAPSLPSGVTVTAVSAGREHSLALLSNHTVMAWGANGYGQLGDGTTNDSDVPVAVDLSSLVPGDTVTAVSAGAGGSLALLNTGEVIAWGDNEEGQLGNGTTVSHSDVPEAVCALASTGSCSLGASNALTGVQAVSSGADHSLALLSNHTVVAWGYNYVGELGDGSTSGPETCYGGGACSRRPVAVSGLSAVKAVSAGWFHSLAVLDTGEVRSWGGNGDGDLGDGNSTSNSDVPVTVCAVTGPCSGGNALSTVEEVSAGGELSLARLASGEVVAWGDNQFGQLGDDTDAGPDICGGTACSSRPVEVQGLGGYTVEEVSAGGTHGLARLSGGTVLAWGENYIGELGDGTTTGPTLCGTRACSEIPEPVSGVSGVTAVSAGSFHSLVIGVASPPASSCVAGWGGNEEGELGTYNPLDSDVPLAVNLPSGDTATAVSAGGDYSLALLSNGRVLAWGYNNSGRLGTDSTANDSDVPTEVTGLNGSGALSGVTAVSAGETHGLALLGNGEVRSWGDNDWGQLGDGSFGGSSDVPVAVKGVGGSGALTGVVAVSAGQGYSLALLNTGAVVAWGKNTYGELGSGIPGSGIVFPNSDVPEPVSGVNTATAVSAGANHSLALLSNGTVLSWGDNTFAELGDGTTGSGNFTDSDVPGPVDLTNLPSGDTVTAVAAGGMHSLALLNTGEVIAWGYNTNGELGDGSTVEADVPVAVSGLGGSGLLSGVTSISAGWYTSLALLNTGEVRAWGEGGFGQLGNGTFGNPPTLVPVAVSGLGTAWAISDYGLPDLALCEVPSPAVVTESLPKGQVGVAYSQTLVASGGSAPYTWSFTAGSLPAGLRLNAESGVIVGTPTAAGTSAFTVEATDSSTPTPRTATADLSISVKAGKGVVLSTKAQGMLAPGAPISGFSPDLVFYAAGAELVCPSNTLTGVLNSNGATKDKGDVSAGVSEGEEASEGCKTSTLGPASIEWSGFRWPIEFTDKGKISIKGTKAVVFRATFPALENATCAFESKKIASTFNTKGPVTIRITAQTFKGAKGNAGLCAKDGKLSGTFNLTSEGEPVQAEL
jgi:alpha-tubulin suppressor-like RCC1 family protein